MTNGKWIIETENPTKSSRNITVVDRLNLNIERGETFRLLRQTSAPDGLLLLVCGLLLNGLVLWRLKKKLGGHAVSKAHMRNGVRR